MGPHEISVHPNGGDLECRWSSRSIEAGWAQGSLYTVSGRTHVDNHQYYIPRPGQGPGQVANIIWPRCVRVIGVQPVGHLSLHNVRLILL